MTTTLTEDLPGIAGGAPAKTTPFPRETRYGAEELKQLAEALDQQTLFYAQGKKVYELEAAFAKHCGAKHGVSCTSGTAAIHIALIAAGISPGDEVITSPITDMGTIVPILFQGAVPIFADLDPRHYTLDPKSVEARITPKTKAIIAVHLTGFACDMVALRKLCDGRDIALIEDCAQAFDCRLNGKIVGTDGDYGCFSFNEFKHIACGDGGIVIANDDARARRLRLATDKCYDRTPEAAARNPTFLGANYRMTELQGAVALAQLGKLDSIIARRRDWCGKLNDALASIPGIHRPEVPKGCDPSWWFYMMRVEPEILGTDADGFAKALNADGIPVGAHYIKQCVYEYPIFANHSAFARGPHAYKGYAYAKGLCPVAEEILDTAVILSINQAYTDTDLAEAIHAIRRNAVWFRERK